MHIVFITRARSSLKVDEKWCARCMHVVLHIRTLRGRLTVEHLWISAYSWRNFSSPQKRASPVCVIFRQLPAARWVRVAPERKTRPLGKRKEATWGLESATLWSSRMWLDEKKRLEYFIGRAPRIYIYKQYRIKKIYI